MRQRCLWPHAANEMGSRAGSCVGASGGRMWSSWLPFLHPQFEQFTPARPARPWSCSTPTLEGEHSPPKPLDRRCCGREHGHMPERSPRVRLAIKKPYWLIGAIPTLYAADLRRVVYRCRLNKYLQVPVRTQETHPPL